MMIYLCPFSLLTKKFFAITKKDTIMNFCKRKTIANRAFGDKYYYNILLREGTLF